MQHVSCFEKRGHFPPAICWCPPIFFQVLERIINVNFNMNSITYSDLHCYCEIVKATSIVVAQLSANSVSINLIKIVTTHCSPHSITVHLH